MSPPTNRSRPDVANIGAAGDWAGNLKSTSSIAAAVDALSHMQRCVVLDAFLDAWGPHNARQARRWEQGRPREGDFLGASTLDDQRARWRRMTAVAEAYRHRASIAPLHELTADLNNVLGEAS